MPACHAGGHEFESRYLSGEFFYAKIQKNGVFVWQFKLIVIFLQIENEIYY